MRDPQEILDPSAVRDADPAIVIVDTWNERWTVDPADWFGETLGRPIEIRRWEVRTFRDALEQGLRFGRRYDAMGRAMQVMGDQEAKLLSARSRTGLHRRAHPAVLESVVVVTSPESMIAAAGWVPEVVDRAGARVATGRSGTAAEAVAGLSAVAPDWAVVCLPGTSLDAASRALDALPVGHAIERARRVVCYDGRGRLDDAGPGLYEAVHDLTALFHGTEGTAMSARFRSWSRGTSGTGPAT